MTERSIRELNSALEHTMNFVDIEIYNGEKREDKLRDYHLLLTTFDKLMVDSIKFIDNKLEGDKVIPVN